MEIKQVTVIGAGTMGAGIASAVISAGFKATMVDISKETLNKGRKTVEKILARRVEKEKMTETDKAKSLGNITFSTDMAIASLSQLVIEVVTENIEVKKKIFSQLTETVSADTIIASNTSALKISELLK